MSNFKHHKMKKRQLILFTVILNTASYSCEPEKSIQDIKSESEVEMCCGNGEEIPPPPPPPSDENSEANAG